MAKSILSKGMVDALTAMDAAQLELAKKAVKLEGPATAFVVPPKLDVALEKFCDAVDGAAGRRGHQRLLTDREVEFVVKAVRAAWASGDRP